MAASSIIVLFVFVGPYPLPVVDGQRGPPLPTPHRLFASLFQTDTTAPQRPRAPTHLPFYALTRSRRPAEISAQRVLSAAIKA